jgi:mRNA-degrading endonuclease RelE of RelBE toxin-antitoxin system
MSYRVESTDTVFADLGTLPKAVRKKVLKSFDLLRENPTGHSTTKKMKGYRNIWRMRLGAYRMVYQVDQSKDSVTILFVGKRADVYDRMGITPDNSGPSIQIVTNLPNLLEPEPTPQEIGKASIELANNPAPQHTIETLLPVQIDRSKLQEWGVPAPFHQALEGIETEEQLLSVQGIPQNWHERVMHLALNMPIEEVIERPTIAIPDADAMEAVSEGKRSLASFLLHLDPDQQSLLDRYLQDPSQGPWLVKGGPGTGKTVAALYAIRGLVNQTRTLSERPKILFTTFTRALSTAAEQLLFHLGVDPDEDQVDVVNIDALARTIGEKGPPVSIPSSQSYKKMFESAMRACIVEDRAFPYSLKDQGFLQDEIDWVILGRGITTRDGYLKADRSDRQGSLDEALRRHIWRFHFALHKELEAAGRRTFDDVLIDAASAADPIYDYVFVDEVHDLKPIAMELAIRLCKDTRRAFITLDPNQSIYGARQGWAETLPGAMAAPRTVVLRKNHRSTAEIWEAGQQILSGTKIYDSETMAEQGPLSGPSPTLVGVAKAQEAVTIANFIHSSLIEERASLGCAAILCPTLWDCRSVAKALPARLRARVMESKDMDLDHNGVKVLTMHAAKGLQFPVVVVARLDKGRFPTKAAPGIDPTAHEQQSRRLLFVACSRAMRRLMILHTANKASPTLHGLNDAAWSVEP